MAGTYRAYGGYKTVQVLSGGTVRDVQYQPATTLPNGLGFAYSIPYDSYLAGDGGGLLDVIATQLEELFSNGQMIASEATQDLDGNGLIADFVTATVQYDQTATGLPPITGAVDIPVQAFFNQDTGIGGFRVPGAKSPNEYVLEEYNRLVALAGG
jgi:hypothetical protein